MFFKSNNFRVQTKNIFSKLCQFKKKPFNDIATKVDISYNSTGSTHENATVSRSVSAIFNIIFSNSSLSKSSAKSCDSLYSNVTSSSLANQSASAIYRRKTPPTGSNSRQPTIIPATNEVRQRVLSARRLRMKTFHNQLADAQQTITVSIWIYKILFSFHGSIQ